MSPKPEATKSRSAVEKSQISESCCSLCLRFEVNSSRQSFWQWRKTWVLLEARFDGCRHSETWG